MTNKPPSPSLEKTVPISIDRLCKSQSVEEDFVIENKNERRVEIASCSNVVEIASCSNVNGSLTLFPNLVSTTLQSSPKQEITSIERITARKSTNHNHLIFFTLDQPISNREKIKNLVRFVIIRIMIPLFSFTILAVLLIEAHTLIDDYCFHPEICQCKDFSTFVYTMFKQILHTHAAIMILLYFCISFITHDFLKKTWLKIGYWVFSLLVFLGFFFNNYSKTAANIEDHLIIYLVLVLCGAALFFIVLIGISYRKISKRISQTLVFGNHLAFLPAFS